MPQISLPSACFEFLSRFHGFLILGVEQTQSRVARALVLEASVMNQLGFGQNVLGHERDCRWRFVLARPQVVLHPGETELTIQVVGGARLEGVAQETDQLLIVFDVELIWALLP